MPLAKINLDGSGFIKYSFGGQSPRLSPDGRYVIFYAMGKEDPSTWIATSDGSVRRVLTSNFTWDNYTQFFPDGSKILFVRETIRDYAIFSCDLNGGQLVQLSGYDYYDGSPVLIY
jgi:Tol biopolymer transport system component